MKPIISVKNLSKKFQIREKLPYYSLRDSLTNLVRGFSKPNGRNNDSFWALKNVSFDVYPGEVLGIIGRNGAGKSTLLKILSQITPPTSGTATLEGRVASLLEVGTGFHPELAGRENIYLNGAILGMSKKEIKKKFDEIVDFAEIEKFLDTPVKHYSSGMYMRLAFAVAAHLEPEILLVDEVLAVGDTQFQKKCLGKMSEVAKHGRTILFISHNMSAIQNLCDKTILLDNGKIIEMGNSNRVIEKYLSKRKIDKNLVQREIEGIYLKKIEFKDNKGNDISSLRTFEEIYVEFECKSTKDFDDVTFALCFNDLNDNRVTSLWNEFLGKRYHITKGEFRAIFHIPSISLIPGEYEISSYIESHGKVIERIDNIKRISIAYTNKFGFVSEPKTIHGLYMEKYSFDIKYFRESN